MEYYTIRIANQDTNPPKILYSKPIRTLPYAEREANRWNSYKGIPATIEAYDPNTHDQEPSSL